jgi:hypothetical protein
MQKSAEQSGFCNKNGNGIILCKAIYSKAAVNYIAKLVIMLDIQHNSYSI